MKTISLRFPNENELNKFIKYIKLMGRQEIDINTLTIKCNPNPIELSIAKEIFGAEIIEGTYH